MITTSSLVCKAPACTAAFLPPFSGNSTDVTRGEYLRAREAQTSRLPSVDPSSTITIQFTSGKVNILCTHSTTVPTSLKHGMMTLQRSSTGAAPRLDGGGRKG